MLYAADNSIFQWFLAVVSYVIAEPDTRAIAQNLAANSLWECARRAGRAFGRLIGRYGPAQVASLQPTDGLEGLTSIVLDSVSDLFAKRAGEVVIKAQRSKYEKIEVTIRMTDESRQIRSMPVTKRVLRSSRQRDQDRLLF